MAPYPGALDALVDRAGRDVESGRLPAAQVAVARQGELIVSEAFGAATVDSRFHTYSAVKPLVSLTVTSLGAEGLLDLDAPVARYLPTFATNGKEAVTISQVLLHAGGFPHAPMPPETWDERAARLATYERWRLTRAPGDGYEYHPSSAHWVLADLITEATGRHHADEVTDRMLAPLGLPRMLAIDPADQADVMDVTSVGTEPAPGAYAELFGTEPPATEVTNEFLEAFNDPYLRSTGHPGGGGLARARDLALWYQAVLHDDGRLLDPAVKQDALTRVRQVGVDWLGVPANRTHAFVLAGDDGKANYRGHGHGASAMAFGHNGAKGQVAAADPATGISFCYLTSGLERDDIVHGRRAIAIASRALACA